MASVIDICNLALSHIGDRANITSIDPPEGSVQAEHCARFYPIARDTLLRMHPWTFAVKRVQLASAALIVPAAHPWQYSYAAPGDLLTILGIYSGARQFDENADEYEYEIGNDTNNTRVIFTNCDAATMRYVSLVTDSTRFPPLFTQAVSWMLASHLAGPVIKGEPGVKTAQAALQTGMSYARQAMAQDANERRRNSVRNDSRHTAPWLANRALIWPYNDEPYQP